MFLGGWLTASSMKKRQTAIDRIVNADKARLKENSDKIELDFEKCEFKSGSFVHEVDDPNMISVKMFAPGSLSSIDTKAVETLIQSYLTYTETFNGTVYNFVSQSFPFDQTTLRFYVLNQNIALYVSRFNCEQFLFELKQ
jgi:hypothetical protein